MKAVSRLLPFLDWIGELKSPAVLRADVIGGVTVALVLIPQSMAYAQLAELPPFYGLYAAFLPPLVAALFGSSRQLQTGPVAVVSLMTAAALEPIATAGGAGYIAYAIMLALMVGVVQLALGLLRLGVLVNFLSHPVVLGFTNAAAIIIATSQLGKIFGVQVEKAEHHYETVWRVVQAAAQEIHPPTLAMALLAFTVMIALRRLNPRLPNVLIAVVLTTWMSWQFDFSEHREVIQAQLVGPQVERVLAERSAALAQRASLDAELSATRQRLQKMLETPDADQAEVLAITHRLDLLGLQRERVVKSMEADLKELRAVEFVLVEDGAQARFHVAGHQPGDAAAVSTGWRLMDIGPDGRVRLHRGGQVVGEVPRGLPSFDLPRIDWGVVAELFVAAVTIALIGFMEAIAVAKGMAARTRQHLDANQELVGQGLGNIVGSLFQSYPTAGSFSRSAVNFDAGARTGFSSAVTSLVVAVSLLWFTPLLYHLPQATLAAVIMLAVIGLVRIRPIGNAWRIDRNDGLVAVLTFVLTLWLAPHLEQGILIGVLVSLGLYLHHTMRPRIVALARHPDGALHDAEAYGLATCPNIGVIRVDGSLYFASAGYLEDKVMEKLARKPDLRFVIIDAEGINRIDATGEEMLRQLMGSLEENSIELLFSRMKRPVFEVLERSGLVARLGRERFFPRTERALEYAWEKLGDDHDATTCPLAVPTPLEKK